MGQSSTAANHANVHALAVELGLDAQTYQRALALANVSPGARQWRQYINQFLTVVGALLIVAGITAFFAWNWAGLSPMLKFALIQCGIVATIVLAWRLGIDSIGGRASLFSGAFLVGVLLAVYGQVYQTGADPYGLFLGWAVLILPWAIIGRRAGLWMLFQVLLNLGFIMYWTQVLYPPDGWWQVAQLLGPLVWLGSLMMDSSLNSLVFILNSVALLVWETGAGRGISWMQGRWYPRVLAFGAVTTVLIPTLIMIIAAGLGQHSGPSLLSASILAVALAAGLYFYQFRKHDLFILTVCLFSAIMVIMSLAIRGILDDIGSMLFLAVLLIGLVAGAASYLRGIAKRWEASS